MTQQISIVNRNYTATIILLAFGAVLMLTYCYAELILTLINSLAIKISTQGLIPVG